MLKIVYNVSIMNSNYEFIIVSRDFFVMRDLISEIIQIY